MNLECVFCSQDLDDWLSYIREASTQADESLAKIRELVEQKNIAKELSDMVIYCVTVPFNVDRKFRHHFHVFSST